MASSGAYPLSLLGSLPPPPPHTSLGTHIATHVTDNGRIQSLLACLCTSPRPALWSPDLHRPPLDHNMLRAAVAGFSLPVSSRARPLAPSDRVMVVLPTGPENALALMAISAYYTAAPVNASCTADELRDDARRLRARAIVTTRDTIERLDLWSRHARDKLEVIFLDFRLSGPAGLFDIAVLDGGTIVAPPRTHKAHRPTPNGLADIALVLHTSGTSGTKKVVPYTLRHLIVGTCCVVDSWQLKPDSININMMPLFHVGGIVRNLWAPLFSCGSAIMCAGFDASTWWTLVRRLGATWYYAAPTMHEAILSSKPSDVNVPRQVKIKMICNAAGGLLPSLATRMRETFRCAILPSYGMTECMPIASPAVTYQLERPGCSGVPCGPHLSIRDPHDIDRPLPIGVDGAVCVRGLPTFDGYEIGPGRIDKSCFSRGGWFDTGDVGHMDADEYLYVTAYWLAQLLTGCEGRSKEIINKGGEVISPFEIEEAITATLRDRVRATLAFSVDHPVLQETIGVIIVPPPNQPRISLMELQNSLRSVLHPSKWPFAIVYMDGLPKNQAGKPLRIKLGQRLGLTHLTDDTPFLQRHFEAAAPDKNAPLTVKIPCKKVLVDLGLIERACSRISGVQEVAVRLRPDGSPEAYIHVDEEAEYEAADIDGALSGVLDGYIVPNPLHVFRQRLARKRDGRFDFETMDAEVQAQSAADMSHITLLVRDCVAKLLGMEPASVTATSDFFLLGGTSLLLGRLIHIIKKETGASLEVASMFTNSTIAGIADLVDCQLGLYNDEEYVASGYLEEKKDFLRSPAHAYEDDGNVPDYLNSHGYSPRSQTHPWVLLVQLLPFVLFYPLKAAWTWTVLLQLLAFSAYYIKDNFWQRVGVLLASLACARLTSRIICPIAAIAFKWVVIGRYRPGKYPMWCNYHLRWWLVNQSLAMSGKGLFNLTPSLRIAYYRLLGAAIGHDVKIDKFAKLGEYDLLTIHDGVRIDRSVVRGFAVERNAYFRLEPIVIGRHTIVNTFTQVSPGAYLSDGTVWGPQASSHEGPSPDGFAAYNKEEVPKPHVLLVLFLGLPIKYIIMFLCYIPWFAALFMLLSQPFLFNREDSVKGVIAWFSYPKRIGWHFVARIVRNSMPPLSNLILGILIKRLIGLNVEGAMRNATQWTLFRRWMCSELLSQPQLCGGFAIIGTHYEMTSVIYRAMGAQVGKRVYWPGSGVYCPDPELLRVGDDVVFGSRSELFTSDSIGFSRISVASGAMIADRVTLLPGTTVDKQAIMGSGALSRRHGYYEPLSVWMGSKHGESVSFGKSAAPPDGDMLTPFGRAFYKRQAPYFVIPYPLIVLTNVLMAAISSVYWAAPAPIAVVIIDRARRSYEDVAPGLFDDHWYRPALVYIYIALAFVVFMPLLAILAFAWAIGTKWAIIGRRREGRYDWDQSSYCQRWQLHLSLQRLLGRGFGGRIIGCISGSWYAVLYLRLLGAAIGSDCAIWAGGQPGLQLTEPELVTMGNRVSLDDASVVAHINSRGRFSLNRLCIGDGCALRTGSRLLSGARMEPNSMLCEHTLVASGEIAEANCVYAGWPARQMRFRPSSKQSDRSGFDQPSSGATPASTVNKLATPTSCDSNVNLLQPSSFSSGYLPPQVLQRYRRVKGSS